MQGKITSILKCYRITSTEDIEHALQCLKHPEKWIFFIQENIPAHLHSQFRQKLAAANIISASNKAQNLLEQSYLDLKQTQLNMTKIEVLVIDDYKWSEKLIDDIHEAIQKRLAQVLKKCDSLLHFFQYQLDHIFDLLSRKGDLKEYFQEIKLTSQRLKCNSYLSELLQKMNFADFIILLLKQVEQKEIIGQMLSNLSIPIPILHEVKDKVILNTRVCYGVLGIGKYSLILNIGSSRVRKCGKTSFISKLMTLDEDFITENHFGNTLNLYTKLSFSKNRNVMLVDFNGAFDNQLKYDIKKAIIDFSFNCSLIILHLHEDQLLQGLLERPQYKLICTEPNKIIIFVRDLEKTGLKALKRCIPQQIKQKTLLRGLRNFKNAPINTQHKQELNFICSNDFNVLQKTISILSLLDQQDKQIFNANEENISEVIRVLSNKFYTKESIIPNICKTEQLSEVMNMIKQENKSVERMNAYQITQNEILVWLKNPALTPFIKRAIQIINFDKKSLQLFAQRLYEWKQQKTVPLRQEFLRLTDILHKQEDDPEQIRKEILENQAKRSHFQLSIDKIIREVIIFNEQAKDEKYNSIISKYYFQNLSNVSPINIIDGKTLQFGNYVLEDALEKISNKYAALNKKVFVVSVIGAQSSAKSTLLNFLFRCKFETSAGRCTKGVYMSFCEMEQMVIIVLDTEGLLSVSERDIAFDHQIASFVLKISNIIIINNKGQLTSTLKQMLEVCLYVLECLHKDEKKESYSPQKILFALRDQTKPKGSFQEEIAAQIKNSLEQMKNDENIDYRNFFSIQNNDILSLPNAYIEVNGLISKTSSLTMFDKTFEKCILGMRKRICDCLRSSSQKFSVKAFYNEAKCVWETVQKCGKQIMNFKTIHSQQK